MVGCDDWTFLSDSFFLSTEIEAPLELLDENITWDKPKTEKKDVDRNSNKSAQWNELQQK